MPFVQLPALSWKILVAALALGMAALVGAETWYGVRILRGDEQIGHTGIDMLSRYIAVPAGGGSYSIDIGPPQAGSSAAKAGLCGGDRIRFGNPSDRWRLFRAGERVKLKIEKYGAGCPRRTETQGSVVLTAEPGKLTSLGKIDYLGRLAVSALALSFALLVAFRKPEGYAYRCLAMMFLLLGTCCFFSFTLAPSGMLADFSKGVQLTGYGLMLFCLVGFAIHYQENYEKTPLRRALLGIEPFYQAFALAGAAFAFVFACGHDLSFLSWYTPALVIAGIALVVSSLVDGLRHSESGIRQRHLWLLAAFVAGSVPAPLSVVLAWLHAAPSTGFRVVSYAAGFALMFGLLLYATLKHSVFDFAYVMSRLTVKTVAGALLLTVFVTLQMMVHELLHQVGLSPSQHPEWWTRVVEAVPAIMVYLLVSGAHHLAEHIVDKLLFHSWETNRERLHTFAWNAGRAASIDSLLGALLNELDRFSGQAGAAVYLQQRDGSFALAGATLVGATGGYDANHGMVVALCSDRAPLKDEPHAAVGIDLAIPMCRGNTMLGFVLMGCKAGGTPYRPDECKALGEAVCQVGQDLRTLQVTALEERARALGEGIDGQRRALLAMLGRRAPDAQAAESGAGK